MQITYEHFQIADLHKILAFFYTIFQILTNYKFNDLLTTTVLVIYNENHFLTINFADFIYLNQNFTDI